MACIHKHWKQRKYFSALAVLHPKYLIQHAEIQRHEGVKYRLNHYISSRPVKIDGPIQRPTTEMSLSTVPKSKVIR